MVIFSATLGYSYAFVQQEADEIEDKDEQKATDLRIRAQRLYLRARNYGIRNLELAHPGFMRIARKNPRESVQAFKSQDVSSLYWTAASWAAAVSVTKDNSDLISWILWGEGTGAHEMLCEEKGGGPCRYLLFQGVEKRCIV